MGILLSRKFLVTTLFIGLAYTAFSIYMMNYRLVLDTIFGSYNPVDKFSLLSALLQGMWSSMTHLALITLILIGILTGANIFLLREKIGSLGGLRKTHLVFGGGSTLGILGVGCATCGLPIVSILGLSGSLIYFPMHGSELSFISVILLSVSFYTLFRNYKNYCEIK